MCRGLYRTRHGSGWYLHLGVKARREISSLEAASLLCVCVCSASVSTCSLLCGSTVLSKRDLLLSLYIAARRRGPWQASL